jgi:hypothetical protein
MHVNVINAGNIQSFDYLLYPEQNPMNQQFIQRQLQSFSSSLTDIGRTWMDSAKVMYDQIYDSRAIRAAKAAVRMAAGFFHPNSIMPLMDLEQIQHAQPVMQRYIMAEPTIREIYLRSRCDGYYPTYVDVHPGRIQQDHYDYRRVMDTIVHDVQDEGWRVSQYSEDLLPEDRDLTFQEQTYMLSTWDIIKMFVEAGSDPTDVYGGTLEL